MFNYIKSENYRLLRIKSLHFTVLICYLLIAAAALVLYFADQQDPNFPYATSRFFYSNVIGSGALVILVGFIYNSALTGKDTNLMKQSISFGISRYTIFWSKLMLTLSYFLLICAIGILLMIALGENLLVGENQLIKEFLLTSVNMLPIVLSGFFITHTLKMLKIDEIYIIISLLFIYVFSGDFLRMLLRPIAGLDELYKFAPDTLLNENLMNFVDGAVQLHYHYWVTGILISVISLLIGIRKFGKQNID